MVSPFAKDLDEHPEFRVKPFAANVAVPTLAFAKWIILVRASPCLAEDNCVARLVAAVRATAEIIHCHSGENYVIRVLTLHKHVSVVDRLLKARLDVRGKGLKTQRLLRGHEQLLQSFKLRPRLYYVLVVF